MKFASDITRVPFGRTDVLIGANDAPSPELSYGHDLKGLPLHGVSKTGTFVLWQMMIVQLEKTWSDSVVQRSRYHHFEFFSRSTRWAWFQRHMGFNRSAGS